MPQVNRQLSEPGNRVSDPNVWWSQTGSNRRPHACKARALPTELWPRRRERVARGERRREKSISRAKSYSLFATSYVALPKLVGLGRLELPTSRLSSARSNQLSYKPQLLPEPSCPRTGQAPRGEEGPGGLVHGRKRNEDGGCPARYGLTGH